MLVREYAQADLPAMIQIWNEVVDDGVAFPQEEGLDLASGAEFFAAQSYAAVAEVDGAVKGLYILHPNNIGRCGRELRRRLRRARASYRRKGRSRQLKSR